ncbi:MAG: chemotaxis protein CheW [Bacillota bacterium]|nr:chemotaxis protein CheW [Bacillota bacterium]
MFACSTFAIGKEIYGIDIKYVIEIIGIQPVTGVMDLPNYIKGIINLRGKIVPVMDIRLRLKKNFKDYNDRTCIIVVNIGEVFIGLIVDNVSEVISIPEGNIVIPTSKQACFSSRYIEGIGKVGNDIALIISCNKLLGQDEVDNINKQLTN